MMNFNSKNVKPDMSFRKRYGKEREPAPASHEILRLMHVSLVKGVNKLLEKPFSAIAT